jgi:hypothetical protein
MHFDQATVAADPDVNRPPGGLDRHTCNFAVSRAKGGGAGGGTGGIGQTQLPYRR